MEMYACACGGMCACKCMYWFSHTHPGTHPCACMYACAPCPPRHDSPLTPPMRQDEWTPLCISAQNGHTDTVRALLEAGATVDAKKKVRGALLSLMSQARHRLHSLLSLSSFALFLSLFFVAPLFFLNACVYVSE